MSIDDLLLHKEELPIWVGVNSGLPVFEIPIHPCLLDKGLRLDTNIAHRVFPQAVKEWGDDLKAYLETVHEEDRAWIESLVSYVPLKVQKKRGTQVTHPLGWEDSVFYGDNGFALSLSISRNNGGTLYFNEGSPQCERPLLLGVPLKGICLTKEKALAYGIRVCGEETVTILRYAHHNVDYYPGALFLRNWAILYLNEAMKAALS